MKLEKLIKHQLDKQEYMFINGGKAIASDNTDVNTTSGDCQCCDTGSDTCDSNHSDTCK
ncbi:hypothetical protein [Flavobacterium columnare]|uniref:hypothetical protein n=1 Tax=Flavobacterium columnare TaxID=996 RepID=UPI0013E2B8A2|nr:hypothetical protein [Flavobacterium columnare]